MGADFYETNITNEIPIGIGERTFIQNAIIDKNARIGNDCRIANDANIQDKDGDGYFIREGLIVVPKNGIIPHGTVI
jgi:glucose-1-phosphate adenylyltransferase